MKMNDFWCSVWYYISWKQLKRLICTHFLASWTSLGCLSEASGGVREASWRHLWSSWAHLGRFGGQEALKRSQGRPQIPPRTSQKGGKRDRCTPFWCRGRSHNNTKLVKVRKYNKLDDKNTKTLKRTRASMKMKDLLCYKVSKYQKDNKKWQN